MPINLEYYWINKSQNYLQQPLFVNQYIWVDNTIKESEVLKKTMDCTEQSMYTTFQILKNQTLIENTISTDSRSTHEQTTKKQCSVVKEAHKHKAKPNQVISYAWKS